MKQGMKEGMKEGMKQGMKEGMEGEGKSVEMCSRCCRVC